MTQHNGHSGLQDGVLRTGQGEAHGCQTKKAAKLDGDVGFHP